MFRPDSQNLVISRQSIFLVTAVGVGLLTLTYVLGVQIGKQSAMLRAAHGRFPGEELQELPKSIAEQLKQFEESAQNHAPRTQPSKPETVSTKESSPTPVENKRNDDKPSTAQGPSWTLQFLSTKDGSEAERLVVKLKTAGHAAKIVKEKGLHKVRLARPASRDDMNTLATKLSAKGFSPFPVKAE